MTKQQNKTEFLHGNEVVFRALVAAGAEMMAGYPITPSTEIIAQWAEYHGKNPKKIFVQTEDEISAGFTVIGGIIAGCKAFTVTAGPGTVLLQDAISMSEAMRIPFVGIVVQRGLPSTGTVIYSQSELHTVAFTGGEGFRIVYSPSNLDELYTYTIKAFKTAWTYRYPTFVLSDGYLGKQKGRVSLPKPRKEDLIEAKSLLDSGNIWMRNAYSMEEELASVIGKYKKDFDKIRNKIVESESYKTNDSDIVIIAHGSVAWAARAAVDELRKNKIKAGLFRPKTIWPYPDKEAQKAVKNTKKILVVESSLGQLERLTKAALYGIRKPMFDYLRPAVGVTPSEIVAKVKEIKNA